MECGLALWQHDNIDKLYYHVAKNYKSIPCQVRIQAPGKKCFFENLKEGESYIFAYLFFSWVHCMHTSTFLYLNLTALLQGGVAYLVTLVFYMAHEESLYFFCREEWWRWK